MKQNNTPKVIFIDWNKTLSYSLFWEQLLDPSHKHNVYHDDISTWLFMDNRHYINPWMRGEISSDKILSLIEKELNIPFSILKEELRLSCVNMKLCDDRIPKLLNKIRSKGIQIVIATDNMDTFRETIRAMKLKDMFDDFLISSEMGILKDDLDPEDSIKFFDEYLNLKGYSYGESVLLDDSPDSSGKYAKFGFNRVIISSSSDLVKELQKYATS